MVTVCSCCGRDLIETNTDFTVCKYCNRFTPTGNKIKGGIIMVKNSTKSKKEEKVKEKSDKKININDIRTENSKKVELFLKETLKVDDIESRKILSRLYTTLSDRINKK